jgi:beta-glucanase (GH16 family)
VVTTPVRIPESPRCPSPFRRSLLLAAVLVSVAVVSLSALAYCAGPEDDGAGSDGHPAAPDQKRPAVDPDSPPSRPGGWGLVFSDEFSGEDGKAPDPQRWQHDVGGGGWGNGELQRYTASTRNARTDGQGRLRLEALRERVSQDGRDDDGKKTRYTSARISTKGRFTTRYARAEARIRVPAGKGLWPAFWLSGVCEEGWPACGEIDVLESVDEVPMVVRSRIHGPGPQATPGIGPDWQVDTRLDEGFHVYAVEWTRDRADFFFDDHRYATVDRGDLPEDDVWALDHPMRLLLNVAVGGRWPGAPTEDTPFPATMLVDWVRVYERA